MQPYGVYRPLYQRTWVRLFVLIVFLGGLYMGGFFDGILKKKDPDSRYFERREEMIQGQIEAGE